MRYNNVELTVAIKDRPITEYPHNGQTFVEGRAGSTFSVIVQNHNPFRVEAVISVDGLSVIDGKEAGPQSSGYVLEAGERLSIPGWKLNDDQVAAFEFAGKGKSYAAASTGSARNTGVIGLLVYKDRNARTYRPQVTHNQYRTFIPQGISMGYVHPGVSASEVDLSYHRSGLESFGTNTLIGGAVTTGLTDDWLSAESSRGISLNAVNTVNTTSVSYTADATNRNTRSRGRLQAMGGEKMKSARRLSPEPVVQQNLGTGFGKAQDFETQTVTFNRGDMVAMIVMYYDDARGLKARGIVLDRRSKNRETQTPNAFPGLSTGCTPPAGWQG